MRRVILSLAFMALAFPAIGAEWTMIPDRSKLEFTATQMGTEFIGGFRNFDVNIRFDPDNLTNSKVDVLIKVSSIHAGAKDRDMQVVGSDWFDLSSFPTARFESAEFRHTGGNQYDVAGNLTIRDQTHPVVIPTTITVEGDQAHAVGTLTIDRTQFGVGQGQWATGGTVGLDVKITFDILANRQG